MSKLYFLEKNLLGAPSYHGFYIHELILGIVGLEPRSADWRLRDSLTTKEAKKQLEMFNLV